MDKSVFTKKGLEYRAAKYYSQIRIPKENWRTIADLEPQILEFEHYIRAEEFDEAARLLNEIDFNYLTLWGYVQRVATMREQLNGKITDPKLDGMHLSYLGYTYYALSRYGDALVTLHAALDIHKACQNKAGEIFTTGCLGRVYHHQGQSELAIQHYQEAIDLAYKAHEERDIPAFLANLGIVFSMRSQYAEAVRCGEEALRIAQNKRDRARALSNLGLAHRGLKRYELALEELQQALSLAYEIDDKRGQSFRLGHIGDLYQELGEYDKAIEHHRNGIQPAVDARSLKLESERVLGLGLAYLATGNYSEALSTLILASEISEEIQNVENQNACRLGLARTYLGLNQLPAALDTVEAIHSESNCRPGFLRALILGRLGRSEESRIAFQTAMECAMRLVDTQPSLHGPKYIAALSLAGLTLLSAAPNQAETMLEVQKLLNEALEANNSLGVIDDTCQLLSEVAKLKPGCSLEHLVRILRGQG